MYQYGGKFVVNPSGGLEAKGHPLGATGLGMHFYIASELVNFMPCDDSDTLDDISRSTSWLGRTNASPGAI